MLGGRAWLVAGVLAVVVACEASPPSTHATNSSTPRPSPAPSLPAGIPPGFADDVASGDVPAAALVPLRAEVTGTWYGITGAGEAMVVAWREPSEDPFRAASGVAAWRRFDDGATPWRPVWGAAFTAKQRVLGIEGVTADVTGDGADDVVLFGMTGGTGACGSYLVVDLSRGDVVYELSDVCDTRLDPIPDPPGLLRTEAVYRPGDAHCCPSAFREATLVHQDDGTWSETAVVRSGS